MPFRHVIRSVAERGADMKLKLNDNVKKALMNVVYPLIALLLVLAVWWIVAEVKDKPLVFPTPDKVVVDFFDLFSGVNFWKAVGMSVARTVICFLISFVSAFLMAVLGGLWKPIHRVISPIISILRSAPTLAIILIIMLWLDGQRAPVVIGFLIAFPLLYQAVYTAITGVDRDLVEMAKLYKVKPFDVVFGLYAHEIAPQVFDVSRSTISLTLKVIIAAEVMTYARGSIGLEMQKANMSFDVSVLLAWTVLAVLLSFVFEGIVAGLKKLWEVRR